jgi:hypothetical protein
LHHRVRGRAQTIQVGIPYVDLLCTWWFHNGTSTVMSLFF